MNLPSTMIAVAFGMGLACATALAGERVSFTTLDGQIFSDVSVTRVVGRKLEIATATGPREVHFKSLPRDVQERFFEPSMLNPPKVGDLLEFTDRNGRAHKGPLRKIAPDGITLETTDGLEHVAYANLPAELIHTFDFDAEDAARHAAAIRAQKLRALAWQRAEAKKAADEQAAQQRNARDADRDRTTTAPTETPMGQRGSQSLGVPRLGGRGLGK